MKSLLIYSILLMMFYSYNLSGQDTIVSQYGATTIFTELERDNGREYEIIVTLPSGYDSDKTYKVLYYLDGYWLNEVVRGVYGIHSLSRPMEELILVGISSVGDEIEWNIQRNLDFTPSVYDIDKMKLNMDTKGIVLDENSTGQAEEFIDFMNFEIIEWVESKYKVDKGARGFLGHSFGGLFGYYALLNENNLFANYALLSPALWWNKSELIEDYDLSMISKKANVFILFGENELGMLKNPNIEMNDLLSANSLLNVTLKSYEGADHNSILPQGIYDVLIELYSKKQ